MTRCISDAAKPIYTPNSSTLHEVAKTWLKPRKRETCSQPGKRKTNDSPDQPGGGGYVEEGYVPTERDITLTDLCLERDGRRCFVTNGADALEPCHIYPYALAGRQGTSQHEHMFWSLLKIFWKEGKVEHWNKTVEGPHGTEFLGNLLCLWSGVHDFWDRALLALKPIKKWPGDGEEEYLMLQFYWMPGAFSRGPIRVTKRPSLSAGLESTPNGTRLRDNQYQKIVSGHEITLKTENKITDPLPSFELLQMQWVLHIVASLSGAAEDLDDDDDEEEEEDYYYYRYYDEEDD
ncbi:hypothetical protein ASPWEDRAFT_734519 [Aspergillus wentii DTO 134E9]|uniref:HNH nuclease domain-containing protein n=1 Tax=Aspergillus wentii DTO 134E9 TaxID=1073089 RepID=A0A1L9RTL6_ASPWE|nr:uncharacterized protein ASPWEDRAFT_734519 [Aspergillus wentii DTO 134E9]OJJ38296.1 hypothetical protein ASPWEDRAFT_734519 [Aspergillus wentii DTO 134E9]